MAVVGIDAGIRSTKVVVLDGGAVLAAYETRGLGGTAAGAERALRRTLKTAGVPRREVAFVGATGIGKTLIPFVDEQLREPMCLARGAFFVLPSAKTVVDLGAQKTLAVKCREGKALTFAMNDKCAAGTGSFLDAVAKVLRMRVADMSALALTSGESIEVLSTCAVFAEAEIISLIHARTRKEDILGGVFRGIAARVYPLLFKVGLEKDVACVGGVARNGGLVAAIAGMAGNEVLVPDHPELVCALGAALISQERAG